LEWFIRVTSTLEEFILELNPMKTESMKGGLKQIHAQEYSKCTGKEDIVSNENNKKISTLECF